MSGGITGLVNVDFYNIVTSVGGAAIYCDVTDNEIFFSYDTGTISLINNGYEVVDSQELGRFMYLRNINEITLKNLSFKYNIVNSDNTNLIDIESVNVLSIKDCEFEHNYNEKGGLVQINQENLVIGDDYINELNIEITGCTLKNNSAITGFSLIYKDNCQKISFEDNIYEFNYAEALIFVENKEKLQASCYEGDTAMYLNLENEQFSENYNKYSIYLKNQANITIFDATFTGGTKGITLDSSTFDSIKLLDDAYLTNTPTDPTLDTQSFIFLKDCILFTATSIKANSISYTLLQIDLVQSITISFLVVSNSKIYVGELLSIAYSDSIALSDVNFSHVELEKSESLIYFKGPESPSSVTIQNVVIDSSKGGLKLDSTNSASINSLKITHAKVSNQALVTADFSLSGSFTLKDSEFEYNYCPILDLKSTLNSSVLVSVSGILVSNCESSVSLVKLDDSLILSSNSLITDSIFDLNSGLPIEVASSMETLNINSCIFTNNTNSASAAGIKAIGTSTIIIDYCEFTANTGSYIMYVELTSSLSYVQTTSCEFKKNSGVAVSISKAVFKDFFSIFTENTFTYAPVLQCFKCDVYLKGTYIYLNTAKEYGCLYINWKSNFFADSVVFKENSAVSKGGGLFVEQESILTISNCTFESNSAEMGSALFIQHNTNNNSVISETAFNNNKAEVYGTISLLDSTILLKDCEFYKNTGPKFPAVVVMFNSIIYIENSQFLSHQGEGAHMSVQSQSSASVTGTLFADGYSDLGASSVNVYDSGFNCTECTFKNDNSKSRSCIDCLQS